MDGASTILLYYKLTHPLVAKEQNVFFVFFKLFLLF